MTPVASVARLGLFTTFAIALASACGGQSFTRNGRDAGSGGSNSAGTAHGGSSSRAGSSSTGGKAHAGSGTGGGSSAGTSSGGGSPVTACDAAPETGMCEAYIPSWYHEPSTGICRPFVYGGCGGNDNRYPTLEACQKACPGGNPNYDACKLPSDCLVTGVACCGICDGPNITAHDLIAYNKQYTEKPPLCPQEQDVSCGACPEPNSQGALKYFVPNCVVGECVVEDIRASEVTACKSNDDCRLRNGTACCKACGGGEVVSVRSDGVFEELVCGDIVPPCLACEPSIPADARATCGQDGHCSVVYLLK